MWGSWLRSVHSGPNTSGLWCWNGRLVTLSNNLLCRVCKEGKLCSQGSGKIFQDKTSGHICTVWGGHVEWQDGGCVWRTGYGNLWQVLISRKHSDCYITLYHTSWLTIHNLPNGNIYNNNNKDTTITHNTSDTHIFLTNTANTIDSSLSPRISDSRL